MDALEDGLSDVFQKFGNAFRYSPFSLKRAGNQYPKYIQRTPIEAVDALRQKLMGGQNRKFEKEYEEYENDFEEYNDVGQEVKQEKHDYEFYRHPRWDEWKF